MWHPPPSLRSRKTLLIALYLTLILGIPRMQSRFDRPLPRGGGSSFRWPKGSGNAPSILLLAHFILPFEKVRPQMGPKGSISGEGAIKAKRSVYKVKPTHTLYTLFFATIFLNLKLNAR